MQKCFASISDTGKYCKYFRSIINDEGYNDTICILHHKRCQDMGYYCNNFIEDKEDREAFLKLLEELDED